MPHKKNYVVITTIVILFLTLLSLHLVPGFIAKYANLTENSNTARVAVFRVNATGTPDEVLVDIGNHSYTEPYVITIENQSEVAVSYDIILRMNEPLPEGVSVVINNKTPVFSDDDKTLTFSKMGIVAATASCEVSPIFVADSYKLLASETGDKYNSTKLDFTFSVIFTQVD